MLALSRAYWHYVQEYEPSWWYTGTIKGKAPRPHYSYVRANQIAENRVQFTILSIEGGRVVARGLTEANPKDLGSTGSGTHRQQPPKTVYRELGPELGTHEDGFPLLTIDDLYDQCEREIARSDSRPIQLYFHPSGVLMQCGRAHSRCSDCTTVSIQTYSMDPLAPYTREFEPSRWACAEPIGLILPGTIAWTHARQYDCLPPELAEERLKRLTRPDVILSSNLERLCGEHCDWPLWMRSLQVCPIFPAPPGFLGVGKPHPEAPYDVQGDNINIIECGSRDLLNQRVTRRQHVPTLKDLQSRSSRPHRRLVPDLHLR
jgi:hypothetical protein